MKQRHGLSLLEVLLATALLSILAAVSIPLIQRAGYIIDSPGRVGDLTQLVDRSREVISDPESFGIDLATLDGTVEIPWTEVVDRSPLLLRRFTTDDSLFPIGLDSEDEPESVPLKPGSWLIFSFEDHHLPYWLPE